MRIKWLKRSFAFFLIVIYSMIITGCIGTGTNQTIDKEADKKKVIGLSLYYRQDEYYMDSEAAFKNEAKKRGYNIVTQDANADLATQIQQLEDFISQKVDLILMAAVEPNDIVPTIRQINKAGIPIIAYDEPPRGGDIMAYVVWDNYEAGKKIGTWAKNYIEDRLQGKADIAILDLPSQYMCRERVEGFTDVVGKLPGVKIVAQEDSKADRAHSMSVTESILDSNKNLNMILGVTDDAAFGAVAAVESSGRDIAVLCAGSWSVEAMKTLNEARENSQAEESKCYKANVTVSPYQQAQVTFDIIDDYFAGKPIKVMNRISLKVYDSVYISDLNWRLVEEMRDK